MVGLLGLIAAIIWLTLLCLTASPAQDWLACCFCAVVEGSYSKSPSLFCVGVFGRGRSSPVSSRDRRTTSSVFTVFSKSEMNFLILEIGSRLFCIDVVSLFLLEAFIVMYILILKGLVIDFKLLHKMIIVHAGVLIVTFKSSVDFQRS